MASQKMSFVSDEFKKIRSMQGSIRINEFTGWNKLFPGTQSSNEIYQTGSGTIYLSYRHVTLKRDLTSLRKDLEENAKIKCAWVDVLFGDVMVETPQITSKVRMLVRMCTFQIFHRKENLKEKRFIVDEFSECSEDGGELKIDRFLGWDHLFGEDHNPDIYQNENCLFVVYSRCTLQGDLTRVHPELYYGTKLPRVWLDPIRGDAVIKTPESKSRVRITMTSLCLQVLTPND